MDIPYDRLGIPDRYRVALTADAPRETRLALTRAALPADAELGVLYALACDGDEEIRDRAIARLRVLPMGPERISQRTHPKVLEVLVSIREDLDERIAEIRDANARTMQVVSARAHRDLAERIADDHERLLLTPQVFAALKANAATPAAAIERAIAFLRMNRIAEPAAPQKPEVDLEAEIAAALSGKTSPHLAADLEAFDVSGVTGKPLDGFNFDFADDAEFSLDLLEDRQGGWSDVEKISIEKQIAAMHPGRRIKLAYLGNKEVRGILIRDRSKMVATAVVKSGRLTDAEVINYSGNRNLPSEVLREIAMNKEWARKYPVQVSLVNNPRTPVSISVGLVDRMLTRDLASLARNRNVSSVVFQKAEKLMRQKKPGFQ